MGDVMFKTNSYKQSIGLDPREKKLYCAALDIALAFADNQLSLVDFREVVEQAENILLRSSRIDRGSDSLVLAEELRKERLQEKQEQ